MGIHPTEPPALATPRGRTVKFTPERFAQIKNLVERGLNREQIAETIGCTLGSLQVTCSRVGISLRRPHLAVDNDKTNGNGAPLRPRAERQPMSETNNESRLFLRLCYRDREWLAQLPLTQQQLGCLAIEAHFRNMSLGELVAKIIDLAVTTGLLEKIEVTHGGRNDTRNDAHAWGQNRRGRLDHQQKGSQP
jgi:hypothetical protein